MENWLTPVPATVSGFAVALGIGLLIGLAGFADAHAASATAGRLAFSGGLSEQSAGLAVLLAVRQYNDEGPRSVDQRRLELCPRPVARAPADAGGLLGRRLAGHPIGW